MHSRPQLDLDQDYLVQAYRAEIDCLRSHRQLIRGVLDNQVTMAMNFYLRVNVTELQQYDYVFDY